MSSTTAHKRTAIGVALAATVCVAMAAPLSASLTGGSVESADAAQRCLAHPARYSIAYHLKGGSNPSGQVTKVKYGKTLKVSQLKTPVKSGYVFKGWFKDAACTKAAVKVCGVKKASSRTLYAKWRKVKASKDSVAAVNGFAAKTASSLLADEGGNSCYSPLSAYMAMSMVGVGAQGETQEQLLSALGVQNESSLKENCKSLMDSISIKRASSNSSSKWSSSSFSGPSSTLQIANSIWSGKNYQFTDGFANDISGYFYGNAESVDFSEDGNKKISNWVSDNTGGLLKPDFSYAPGTAAVLVNTVYLKDNWVNDFDESCTKKATFHAKKGDVSTKFMRQTTYCSYGEGEGYTTASLSLNSGAEMTFYLPDEGTSATSLISSSKKVKELLSTDTENTRVVWKLPKFSFDCNYDLNGTLEACGMESAFNPVNVTDFDAMLSTSSGAKESFRVDHVSQGTHIGVDEKGVEAAAYTAADMCASAAMVEEPVRFTLDRPFVYSISAKNGTVLFIGVMQDPTA